MLPNNETSKPKRSDHDEEVLVLPLVREKTIAEFSAAVNLEPGMVKTLMDIFRSEQPEIMRYILYARDKAKKGMTANEYQAYVAGAGLVYTCLRTQMIKDLEDTGLLNLLGISYTDVREKESEKAS